MLHRLFIYFCFTCTIRLLLLYNSILRLYLPINFFYFLKKRNISFWIWLFVNTVGFPVRFFIFYQGGSCVVMSRAKVFRLAARQARARKGSPKKPRPPAKPPTRLQEPALRRILTCPKTGIPLRSQEGKSVSGISWLPSRIPYWKSGMAGWHILSCHWADLFITLIFTRIIPFMNWAWLYTLI